MGRRALSVLLISTCGTVGAGAQVVIPDRVECDGCDLRLEQVQVLGLAPDAELLEQSGPKGIVRGRDGSVWVMNGQITGIIQVFGPNGSLELFSREGDGPGEFRYLQMMTCTPEGDILFTGRTSRFHQINTATREITQSPGSVYGPRQQSMLSFSDSLVWLSAPSRDERFVGYPLVSYDPRTGRPLNAWGKTVEHYDAMVELHALRVLDRFPDGRILAGHTLEYVLDIYADNGQLLRQIVRDAPWFEPQTTTWIGQHLMVVHPLDERFVLTSVLVRPTSWMPGRAERRPEDRELAKMFDTVLEVLDVVQGRVVYRERMDEAVIATVCPSGELVVAGMEGERETLTLYRIHFTQGG